MSRRTAGALVVAAWLGAACTGSPPPGTRRALSTPVPATPQPVAAPTPDAATHWHALAASLRSGDPANVAATLRESEAALAAGDARAGRRQQAAYREIVDNPEWIDDVLARLDAALHAEVRANVDAGTQLMGITTPRDALPPWRIVEPPPAAELRGHYAHASQATGVDWSYLAAIHLVETRMGRIIGTSTAGARGPMQFMPATWERYGAGDIEDARDAIAAAARYLAASGAPADMGRALFAYNRSRSYVAAVSAYAERMRADERSYGAYHAWEVYYRTTRGDALLAPGYPDPRA